MISWLIDLILSNIWILFIAFWLYRSVTKKGVGQGREAAEEDHVPTRQQPMPMDIPWERDLEPIFPRIPVDPMDIPKEAPVVEDKEPLASPRSARIARAPKAPMIEREEAELPAEVQGMIWSQVYGAPRSKVPHPSRRKF